MFSFALRKKIFLFYLSHNKYGHTVIFNHFSSFVRSNHSTVAYNPPSWHHFVQSGQTAELFFYSHRNNNLFSICCWWCHSLFNEFRLTNKSRQRFYQHIYSYYVNADDTKDRKSNLSFKFIQSDNMCHAYYMRVSDEMIKQETMWHFFSHLSLALFLFIRHYILPLFQVLFFSIAAHYFLSRLRHSIMNDSIWFHSHPVTNCLSHWLVSSFEIFWRGKIKWTNNKVIVIKEEMKRQRRLWHRQFRFLWIVYGTNGMQRMTVNPI